MQKKIKYKALNGACYITQQCALIMQFAHMAQNGEHVGRALVIVVVLVISKHVAIEDKSCKL